MQQDGSNVGRSSVQYLVARKHSIDEQVGVGRKAATGGIAAGHQSRHECAMAHIYTFMKCFQNTTKYGACKQCTNQLLISTLITGICSTKKPRASVPNISFGADLLKLIQN